MDSLEGVAEEGGAQSSGPRSVMAEVMYALPACWSCMSTMRNSCPLFMVVLQWMTPVTIQEMVREKEVLTDSVVIPVLNIETMIGGRKKESKIQGSGEDMIDSARARK